MDPVGTGSFGKAFLDMALGNYNPKKMIVFSREEMNQWEMAKRYVNDERVRFLVTSQTRSIEGLVMLSTLLGTKVVSAAEYPLVRRIKDKHERGNESQ